MSELPGAPEPVLAVSPSPCLRRRLRDALVPAGVAVEEVAGAAELAKHRRQRPFLVCIVDARGPRAAADAQGCHASRPAERYVFILNGPQRGGEELVPESRSPFGFLREPFGGEEVRAWARRAAAEARLLRGDCSLEDLLHGRFRAFLSNLGPQGPTCMHGLVLERVERPLLRAVLEWTGGNQTRASEVLGIHRNTLRAKIRALGIDPSRFGPG